MIDFVQLQEDVTQALLCAGELASINVVQFRKLRAMSEVDASAVYAVPRAGLSGAGILVEMPTFEVAHPNLPGPSAELVLSLAVLEEPNINMVPGSGTMLSAEEIAQWALDSLHGLVIENMGSLYADKTAIAPANEFEGLVAYRVSLRLRSLRPQSERVAMPDISEDALQVTLTCATAGAAIYYTQDGSFPGPSNAQAVRYEGAFVMSGEVLRWTAFKAGMVGSNVGEARNET